MTGDLISTGSLVHMQQFTAHLHVPGLLSLPATFTDYSATSRRTDVSGAAPALAGRSLWLLGEDHPVRVWLYDLVTARSFDYAMFALILLNCVTMAYEYPGMHKGALDYTVLHWRWGRQRGRAGGNSACPCLRFPWSSHLNATPSPLQRRGVHCLVRPRGWAEDPGVHVPHLHCQRHKPGWSSHSGSVLHGAEDHDCSWRSRAIVQPVSWTQS